MSGEMQREAEKKKEKQLMEKERKEEIRPALKLLLFFFGMLLHETAEFRAYLVNLFELPRLGVCWFYLGALCINQFSALSSLLIQRGQQIP